MIRHLVKLVWRRKRGSALLILEVAASFIVVFAVVAAGLYFAECYRRPLGFDWRDVFAVSFASGSVDDEPWDAAKAAALGRLIREAAATDGVAAIAAAWSAPYDGSTTIGMWEEEGRRLEAEMIAVTDAFREVLRLDIVRGRWFEESDSALAWRPVVVDEETARTLFGDEDPIGRSLPRDKGEPESRIVGMVHDFRKAGELSAPRNFFFRRIDLEKPDGFPPRLLVVRARPGAGTDFEERLVRRLRAVEPSWSFDARSLGQNREMAFREVLTPLAVGAVIAGFLLLMVSLGLIGVLWQNVTRRTREIGLRRALGAAGADVQVQILTELLIATLAGVVLGGVVVVQVPLLNLFASVSAGVYAAALLVSAAAIGLITLAAGLYPSWLATRVQPADALREE